MCMIWVISLYLLYTKSLLIPRLSIRHSIRGHLPTICHVLLSILLGLGAPIHLAPLSPLTLTILHLFKDTIDHNPIIFWVSKEKKMCTWKCQYFNWAVSQLKILVSYLWYAFGHVGGFFAPVALHYVAFDGCSIYRNNCMGSTFMGGKPVRRTQMSTRNGGQEK